VASPVDRYAALPYFQAGIDPGYEPKICLAKHDNFVMMRETYEENITFRAVGRAHPLDRMRMFDISCR
jgi:hypothetical protein